MSERYEIIKEEELTDIWYKDFPIELNKTRLLYDNQTGNVLIQFKLTNVCTKIINTVYLKINCYDVSKTVVDSVEEHVIPMLSVKQNESFGDKAPAVSKDRRTADVNVIITKIVFSDGSVWENGNNYRPIQVHAPEEITFAPHIASRFKSVSGHLPNIRYMFREYDGYWRCTCGRINYQNANKCSCCACKREELRNLFSEEYLKELIYQNAKAKMDSNTESEYIEAISIFNTIKDYKDSEQLIEECNVGRRECIYKYAVSLIEEDNTFSYESAKTQLKKIPDWRNSKELIEHCDTRIQEIHNEAEKQKEIQRVAKEKAKKKAKRKAIIICSVVVAIIIGIILFMIFGFPAIRYNNGISLMNSGKYDEAIAVFESLGEYSDSKNKANECKYNKASFAIENSDYISAYDTFISINDYKDSKQKAESIFDKYKLEKIKKSKVGDKIILGACEQDLNAVTTENIEWIVLDITDKEILLLSNKAIYGSTYHKYQMNVTWQYSSIRNWLNNDFYEYSFTNMEKSVIKHTSSAGCKVFLFSIDEAKRYLNDDTLKCTASAYAESEGAINSGDLNTCSWWLLTTKNGQSAYVDNNGNISDLGDWVCYYESNGEKVKKYHGVRPAMWIDLSKIK